MNTIHRAKGKHAGVIAALGLALIAIAAWWYAGAPFPNRYQIVGGGREAVTMVDTATGKIRVFIARKFAGDPGHDYRIGSVEFIELTKP